MKNKISIFLILSLMSFLKPIEVKGSSFTYKYFSSDGFVYQFELIENRNELVIYKMNLTSDTLNSTIRPLNNDSVEVLKKLHQKVLTLKNSPINHIKGGAKVEVLDSKQELIFEIYFGTGSDESLLNLINYFIKVSPIEIKNSGKS